MQASDLSAFTSQSLLGEPPVTLACDKTYWNLDALHRARDYFMSTAIPRKGLLAGSPLGVAPDHVTLGMAALHQLAPPGGPAKSYLTIHDMEGGTTWVDPINTLEVME